jgi:hypothetical protein
MSEIFYSADGQVQTVDLIEHMTSDQYYLDGSLKIAGSVISNKFLNEAGEPIGLPKNVNVKGSLQVNNKTELKNTKIDGKLEVNGPVGVNGVLNVRAIQLGNITLTNSDNSLRIQNMNGYIDIGTKNKDWGHIHTDRPRFSLNKDLVDTRSKNYQEYVKYTADGGVQVNNFDLTTKFNELIVKNRLTNKVNMTVHKDGSVSLLNKLPPNTPETPPTPSNVKTWYIKWIPKLGSLNFVVGNKIALHIQIRDTDSIMYSNIDRKWVNQKSIPLPLVDYPRPLDFSVTFDKGFVISIGENRFTYPDYINITNVNNINAVAANGIVITEFKPSNWKPPTNADITTALYAAKTAREAAIREQAAKAARDANAKAAREAAARNEAAKAMKSKVVKPKLISDIETMNPLGWFDANNFDQNTQKWVSKDGRYTINTSNARKATSPFPLVYGGTNSTLTNIPWPGRGKDYTFIHVAKYNGNTRGRIWTGIGSNWLSGFWNNSVSFYHEGWYNHSINASNSGRDWLLSVDMNNFVRVNRGTYQKNGPAFSPAGITVGTGNFAESSDWAIVEFLIFNKKLSQDDYSKVEEYLAKKYGLFGSSKESSLSLVYKFTKQFSVNNIANDVKSGKFNNINNADFVITNDLNFWKLRTEFSSNDYYNSWQSIIGNMYNSEVPGRGWGLWVNPNGILHWSGSSTTFNLNNIGKLQNNVSYRLDIVFNNNQYTFILTNLSNNTTKSETVNKTSSMITDRGFVTIGGAWRNTSEKFKGSINNMLVSTENF